TWAAGSLRGFVVWFGLARAGWGRRWSPKRLLTVTFQNSSRFCDSGSERRETDGLVVCGKRMCLELVKNDWGLRGLWLSDQSGQKISIELESLILAQNER